MIKRMAMMTRRHATSPAEFNRYWLGVHGELLKQAGHVHRYQQNPVLAEITCDVDAPPPFRLDGLVELWFESEADMRQCFDSPAGRELPVDEERFLSAMTRHDVVDAPQPDGGFKLLLAASGRPGEDGAKALGERLSMWSEALGGSAQASVFNPVQALLSRPNLPAEPVAASAFLQFVWADECAAREAVERPGLKQALWAASPAFAKLGAYLVQERRVI